MTQDRRLPFETDAAVDVSPARRLAAIGAAIAVVAAGLGQGLQTSPAAAVVAVNIGILGMLVAGFGIARRPKDSPTLLIAGATALLASLATHPDWDSIRLMQWVMAAVAAVAGILVLLPRTYQRIAVSVFVLYHFAGIVSAITSPAPTPWMTGQLWAHVFRPHLEFCYVNNAYQFYSPQPGAANVLWFCIYYPDDTSRWIKMPRRNELLDPLAVEYYRRLSLTERANQNIQTAGPTNTALRARWESANRIPGVPGLALQYRAPNEHARQILASYARHINSEAPIRSVKIYLTQHRMLTQKEFADGKDPYDRDTYWPFFVGHFDGNGALIEPYDPLLYWIVPIIKRADGGFDNYVRVHAGSDPFEERPDDKGQGTEAK
jgi:hypothetical protein